ncbi:MAG TPA: diguanylate cyclase [Pseudomonadales bacterium]|nr:diguanylate cyclase [Pseudomonadales bacterium]
MQKILELEKLPLGMMLETALEQAYNPALITDADFVNDGPHILYANPAFCKMTGYSLEQLLGRNPRFLQGERTDRQVIDRLRTAITNGEFFSGATVNYRQDGSPYYVEWNITPIVDQQGNITHFLSMHQDLSGRIESQRRNRILTGALDVADDAIFITNQSQQIIFINTSFERLTGYQRDEVLGKTPAFLNASDNVDMQQRKEIQSAIRESRVYTGIMHNRTKEGREIYVHQSISPLRLEDTEELFFISISKDVTKRMQERKQLEVIAFQDQLTSLMNRRGAQNALEDLLEDFQGGGEVFSLAICDIDHFKAFNDNFGHSAGDRVLCAVADCLLINTRHRDIVCRWGGEEFLIAFVGANEQEAWTQAERLRQRVLQLSLDGLPAITISIGVGMPKPREALKDLFNRVDEALYNAKGAGRNRTIKASELDN